MSARRSSIALSLVAVAGLAAPAFAEDAAGGAGESRGILALVLGVVLAVVALLISLGLAMFAVSKAIQMFDRTTKGMDEWAELRKGNVAVGLLMASMILAVGNVVSSSVAGLTQALMDPKLEIAYLADLLVGVVNLLIGIWIATSVVSLAIKVLDRMTKDVDEMAEIAKGNVAVSVMVSGVLLAVSVVVAQGVAGISRILDVQNIWANVSAGF